MLSELLKDAAITGVGLIGSRLTALARSVVRGTAWKRTTSTLLRRCLTRCGGGERNGGQRSSRSAELSATSATGNDPESNTRSGCGRTCREPRMGHTRAMSRGAGAAPAEQRKRPTLVSGRLQTPSTTFCIAARRALSPAGSQNTATSPGIPAGVVARSVAPGGALTSVPTALVASNSAVDTHGISDRDLLPV